ncbi:hypothetical protein MRX96_013954 [Rhipicephalus microplus]
MQDLQRIDNRVSGSKKKKKPTVNAGGTPVELHKQNAILPSRQQYWQTLKLKVGDFQLHGGGLLRLQDASQLPLGQTRPQCEATSARHGHVGQRAAGRGRHNPQRTVLGNPPSASKRCLQPNALAYEQ